MAKKATPKKIVTTPPAKSAAPAAAIIPSAAPIVTAVRNSPIPKAVKAEAPAKNAVVVTQDAIATRAYEISRSPVAGDELSNWLRAESELRGA